MDNVNSVTKKVLVIVGLALVLILPLSQVQNQIADRREYESLAQKEVAKGWGGDVKFSSPELTTVGKNIYPTTSETTIQVDSQEKERGVFHVPVYVATLRTTVTFSRPAVPNDEPPQDQHASELAYLTLLVKPTSSIQSFKITELASGKEVKAKLVEDGIRLSAGELHHQHFFDTQLVIEVSSRGTGPLTYEASSDQDKVRMVGNWTKPKFVDDVLPTETHLSAGGFEAFWTLSVLPKWDEGPRPPISIGINHLWIGTDYSMIERAVKYGVLFIALTFLLVFIVEFMSKAKIHPLQYGMIGLSISIFYLLLLAISETSGFDIAYIISSAAVTGLIVFYVHGFLNQKKFVRMVLSEQVILSAFFYVLLSLEERAFLIGSLGLFTALAIFMTITRRFDWYSGSFKTANEGQA